jgi:hypothetical protein
MRCAGERTAVFFSNGVGDHVFCLPALRALAKALDGSFVLAFPEGPQAFIFDDLQIERLVEIPFDGGARFSPHRAAALIGAVDTFISLTSWMSPSLAGLLLELNPTWSLGFFPEFHRHLTLDFMIHSADLLFKIPQTFDPTLRLEAFARPVPLPEIAARKAIDIRGMLAPGMRILAIHNETREHKIWDSGRLAAAVHGFLDHHPNFVALSIGLRPVTFGHDRIIECNGFLPLSQSFALVASADFFLGVDSCMLHVADFARVPSVGLFGPTKAHEFGFRLGPHIAIQANKSMTEIEDADVLNALESIVSDRDQAVTISPCAQSHAARFYALS